MSPTSRRGWLAVMLLLAMTVSARAQSFGFPWWRDAQFQKDLSLTNDQSARIDTVFQATISLLRQKRQELDQRALIKEARPGGLGIGRRNPHRRLASNRVPHQRRRSGTARHMVPGRAAGKLVRDAWLKSNPRLSLL